MEISRRSRTVSSGDKFSFPVAIPSSASEDSDQFEFGCITTPGSPNSPADRLFSNGKLLPHVFPIDQYQSTVPYSFSYSRSTSRTSSISSKDSLLSSRSNSTNSRSSNCSSARTSTSEASERRLMASANHRNIPARKERNRPPPPILSSQRWQLIAAAPVLKHQGSRSRKAEINLDRKGSKRSTTTTTATTDNDQEAKSWFGKRIIKSFILTCKECHGIKTGTVERAVSRNLEV